MAFKRTTRSDRGNCAYNGIDDGGYLQLGDSRDLTEHGEDVTVPQGDNEVAGTCVVGMF